MFMFPKGQSRLRQIFSARYLELVPEKTLKGASSLILIIDVVAYLFVNLPAKVGISLFK
jgi:hypothetical protein